MDQGLMERGVDWVVWTGLVGGTVDDEDDLIYCDLFEADEGPASVHFSGDKEEVGYCFPRPFAHFGSEDVSIFEKNFKIDTP